MYRLKRISFTQKGILQSIVNSSLKMYVELKARVYTVLYTLLQYTLLIEHLSYGVKIRM